MTAEEEWPQCFLVGTVKGGLLAPVFGVYRCPRTAIAFTAQVFRFNLYDKSRLLHPKGEWRGYAPPESRLFGFLIHNHPDASLLKAS